MTRATRSVRFALVLLVCIVTAWMMLVAGVYRFRVDQMETVRAPAERIVRAVELIEIAPPEERQRIADALTSPIFEVSFLSPEQMALKPGDPVPDDELLRQYADVLDGRELIITAPPGPLLTRLLPGFVPPLLNGLEFHIALHTGEILMIRTISALAVTRFGLPIGFGAGLLGTLIGLASIFLMLRETKPLANLAAAVDRIDLSPETVALPDGRRNTPEIRAVIAAFNRLQSRLTSMMQSRMALVGGISHDVRTFATRLRLRVESIPDGTERGRAIADIEDMIRMLDDALLSSKAGAGELTQELVEFSELVSHEADDRRKSGAPVDLEIGPGAEDVLVLGERLALRRIIANLTDNALKYGSVAHLALHREDGEVLLVVEDEGPGIPQSMRGEMLEPFSRLESSRNRGTGGAGLGLAIVRALCEGHGGSVEIGEAPAGGARLTVRLPVFQS